MPSTNQTFPGRYHLGKISAAKYLTEIICERIAKQQKKELMPNFWRQPFWSPIYRFQMIAANRLLKMYSIAAILATLRENRGTYSLNAKWLDPIIQQHQLRIEREEAAREQKFKEAAEIEAVTPITAGPLRENFTPTKSKLSKLRGLDE